MKTSEAVEALKQGKIIIGMPSNPPMDKFDYCSTGRNCYRLYRGDKVVVLKPVSECVAEVRRIIDLDQFATINDHSYLNFSILNT